MRQRRPEGGKRSLAGPLGLASQPVGCLPMVVAAKLLIDGPRGVLAAAGKGNRPRFETCSTGSLGGWRQGLFESDVLGALGPCERPMSGLEVSLEVLCIGEGSLAAGAGRRGRSREGDLDDGPALEIIG